MAYKLKIRTVIANIPSILVLLISASVFAQDTDVQRNIAKHWADAEASRQIYYSKERNTKSETASINNEIAEVEDTLKSSPPDSSTHLQSKTRLFELLEGKYGIRMKGYAEKISAVKSIILSMLKVEDDQAVLSKNNMKTNSLEEEALREDLLNFIQDTTSKAKTDLSMMAHDIDANADPVLVDWVKSSQASLDEMGKIVQSAIYFAKNQAKTSHKARRLTAYKYRAYYENLYCKLQGDKRHTEALLTALKNNASFQCAYIVSKLMDRAQEELEKSNNNEFDEDGIRTSYREDLKEVNLTSPDA